MTVHSKSLEETQPVEHHTRLVGNLAVPFGLYPVRVEAVGLVTGLHGTGSDPPPSPQRALLIEEMQTRSVTNPNSVLASGNTSLVLMQGFLRPGIQKGDHFDVELRVPGQSETTSLRGGYLLETQLREMAVLENRVREGNVLALVQGPVLVDPLADAKSDKVAACRGRILGGGVALKSRSLGLVLKPDYQSVANSSRGKRGEPPLSHFSERRQGGHGKGEDRRIHRVDRTSALQRQYRPIRGSGAHVGDFRIGVESHGARARLGTAIVRAGLFGPSRAAIGGPGPGRHHHAA